MAARDVLLSVWRKVEIGRNAANEPTYELQEQGKIWAGRVDLSDAEAVSAGQEAGARVSRFTMRANALSQSITSNDELRHDLTGAYWNVTGMVHGAGGRQRMVIVSGVQRSDG